MRIELTRRYRFCAAHRLFAPELSYEENLRLFGKCTNPHGHGHNYHLEVTVAGRLDRKTGLLLPRSSLDELVETVVLKELDYRNLNADVPEFGFRNPTSENLLAFIACRLQQNWPEQFQQAGLRLRRLRLFETPRNIFELELDTGDE